MLRTVVTTATFLVLLLAALASYRSRYAPQVLHTTTNMAAAALKYLIVAPRAKHTATVIFVHGLGDTGAGWQSLAEMYARDSNLQHVKWILPHAPVAPVTANNGFRMPAWFDIFEFGSINAREDEEGMLKTMYALNQLITAEVDAGIPANRIVLGGFSQGAAMSLLTGLTTERRLAGLGILSGWLPIRNKVKAMVSDHAKKLPIFWGHGTVDPIVRFDRATLSMEFLKKELGINNVEPENVLNGGIEFHAYEGLPHSADPEELDDLKTFLKKVVPAQE
ncbi:Phospholipase/carboxylesterase [Lentinus tigrinus ALCF2SS1-7]|uniref:Acyl-protein thioesterase 1 n=1 Tax=Lentinus tigrinus ALCF2SS1-6 TaxID=1328759 RepID=A0A5C2T6J7_9APHY|nr:Phospholipase/carboxylesterase [Lentinus tigrinus ALCF2SS1-6]RPD81318.1 Phospholipase/carboxylesterase [Lentinus tigrinus ALCF2SS1-7]